MLADYDRADGRLTIRSGKGKKDRTIYVQGAQTALDDWLVLRGDRPGPILTSTTRAAEGMTDQAVLVILKKRATAAGVAPFSPHDLRRTMITRLLDAGADMISVSAWLAIQTQRRPRAMTGAANKPKRTPRRKSRSPTCPTSAAARSRSTSRAARDGWLSAHYR